LEQNKAQFLEISAFLLFVEKLLAYSLFVPNSRQFESLLVKGCIAQVKGIFLFFVAAILFGAPLFRKQWETVLWSSILASMTLCPLTLLSSNVDEPLEKCIVRVYCKLQPETRFESNLIYTGIGAVLGAWMGAIPIPLDWDMPWQAWPVSLVYGSVFGSSVGAVVALIMPNAVLKLSKNE